MHAAAPVVGGGDAGAAAIRSVLRTIKRGSLLRQPDGGNTNKGGEIDNLPDMMGFVKVIIR
jgi:hypothetical protein